MRRPRPTAWFGARRGRRHEFCRCGELWQLSISHYFFGEVICFILKNDIMASNQNYTILFKTTTIGEMVGGESGFYIME